MDRPDLGQGGSVGQDRYDGRVHGLHRHAGEEAMMRRAVALLIAGVSVAGAQKRSACATPNPSAAWVLVQRTTLSEEDGAWKNDSLRRVLLTAAKVKGPNVPF